MIINQQRLKELLHYNPETGWFTNLVKRNYNAPVGKRAGKVFMRGRYRCIALDGIDYYEHHLAWLYLHGYIPERIEHWDGNGTNNAEHNLRECTQSQNMCNKPSPVSEELRGAYLDTRRGHWYSQIQYEGENVYLGRFDSAEEAHQAWLKASELLQGEFAFHNRIPDVHRMAVERQSPEEPRISKMHLNST